MNRNGQLAGSPWHLGGERFRLAERLRKHMQPHARLQVFIVPLLHSPSRAIALRVPRRESRVQAKPTSPRLWEPLVLIRLGRHGLLVALKAGC